MKHKARDLSKIIPGQIQLFKEDEILQNRGEGFIVQLVLWQVQSLEVEQVAELNWDFMDLVPGEIQRFYRDAGEKTLRQRN